MEQRISEAGQSERSAQAMIDSLRIPASKRQQVTHNQHENMTLRNVPRVLSK